jgi:hypothetical protein
MTRDTERAAIEELREILGRHATGEPEYAQDEERFAMLRAGLRANCDLSPLLPAWLKHVRTLGDWWDYIKPRFEQYAERPAFLASQFDRVLTFVEDGVDPSPPETVQTGTIRTSVPAVAPAAGARSGRAATTAIRIFVVHGHNHGPRDAVARLLTRLGSEPVILEEQPNGGYLG